MPLSPRTHPVKLLPDKAAYVIISSSIFMRPDAGKPEEEVRVIVVSIAVIAPSRSFALAEKVTSPADVVFLRGVISLYPPPSLI